MNYYLVLKNNLGEFGYAYLGDKDMTMITPEIDQKVLDYKFDSEDAVHKRAIELEVPSIHYTLMNETEMMEKFQAQQKSKEKCNWVVCYINKETSQKNYLKIRITPTGKREIYYEPGIKAAALFDKSEATTHGQNILKLASIDKNITSIEIERIA